MKDGLGKNVGHGGWVMLKNFKVTLAKMLQKLLFGVGVESLPEILKWIDRPVYLLISGFLVEFQSQQKLATNITYFTI